MTRTENFDSKLFTEALITSVNSGARNALNEATLKRVGLTPKEYKADINALYRAILTDDEDMIRSLWKFLLDLLDGNFKPTSADVAVMQRAALGIVRKADRIKHDDGRPDELTRAYASIIAPNAFRAMVELILAHRSQKQVVKISDNALIIEEQREKTRKEKQAEKIAKAERRKAEKAKKQAAKAAAQPKEEAKDVLQEQADTLPALEDMPTITEETAKA